MDYFADARVKLRRAADHLVALKAGAEEYAANTPFSLGYRHDSLSDEHVILLEGLREPPPEICLGTGECVQALRTSLDYSIAALIECCTGEPPRADSRFEFPIFLDQDAYQNAKRGKKLAGVDPEDVKLIDSIQPFTSPEPASHPLWLLHRLNIADKHRQLHVVAGALWMDSIEHVGAAGARAFSIEDRWVKEPLRFPLEKGCDLLRYRSTSPLPSKVNVEFQAILLFDQPQEAHKWLVLPLLDGLVETTARVVEGLASAWSDEEGG